MRIYQNKQSWKLNSTGLMGILLPISHLPILMIQAPLWAVSGIPNPATTLSPGWWEMKISLYCGGAILNSFVNTLPEITMNMSTVILLARKVTYRQRIILMRFMHIKPGITRLRNSGYFTIYGEDLPIIHICMIGSLNPALTKNMVLGLAKLCYERRHLLPLYLWK